MILFGRIPTSMTALQHFREPSIPILHSGISPPVGSLSGPRVPTSLRYLLAGIPEEVNGYRCFEGELLPGPVDPSYSF